MFSYVYVWESYCKSTLGTQAMVSINHGWLLGVNHVDQVIGICLKVVVKHKTGVLLEWSPVVYVCVCILVF